MRFFHYILRVLLLMPLALEAQVPAKRIITLAPHATEIAFAAGLGNHIIGVSEHSDFPEKAKQIETIANYQGIKLERILALEPDLVIAWPAGHSAKEIDKLRQFGIPIYESHTKTLDDIATNIEQLATFSDNPAIGRQAAADFRRQLTALKMQYHTEQPVSYFYQLSDKPIMTVAGNHWPSDVFRFCGGQNIFEQVSSPYPQVSVEQVIVREPQVLFTSSHTASQVETWSRWQQEIPALKNGHTWSLNPDWLNRPTPRTLLAVKAVCAHLQTVRESTH